MSGIFVDLSDAHRAFDSFLNLNQYTHIDVLQVQVDQMRERISDSEEVLTNLALQGLRRELPGLLSKLLQEWAELEAATLLIQFPTTTFSPSDPDLQRHFKSNLRRQYDVQSGRLLALLKQYEQERAKEQEKREMYWRTFAHSAIERQQEVASQSDQRQQLLLDRLQQTNQQWFERQQGMVEQYWQANQQWFQREQEMASESQRANQHWAQLALTGIQQGQLGVQQYTQFAASVQENVAKMLEASAQTQDELAQSLKATRKRGGCLRSLVIAGVVALLIFLLAFGFAVVGAMHLFTLK